jgi:hypothetical protein
MQNNVFSIFINSCDSFEDCWFPFFKLFSKYWPDYKGIIYLNTEYKSFSYDGLNIVCTKVCEANNVPKNKRATWSQCLKWALEQIDTDIILYMQEDYFLKDFVKNSIVINFVSLMHENSEISCIHLTDQAVIAESKLSKYKNLHIIKRKQRYRISCQAALWKKDVLSSYIRTYENAWQFEEFGSKRAAISDHNFYVVDNNWVKLNSFEIIPYIFTGIIQGKWKDSVLNLFNSNNIVIDYTLRGMHEAFTQKKIIDKIRYKKFYFSIYFKNIINTIILKCTK